MQQGQNVRPAQLKRPGATGDHGEERQQPRAVEHRPCRERGDRRLRRFAATGERVADRRADNPGKRQPDARRRARICLRRDDLAPGEDCHAGHAQHRRRPGQRRCAVTEDNAKDNKVGEGERGENYRHHGGNDTLLGPINKRVVDREGEEAHAEGCAVLRGCEQYGLASKRAPEGEQRRRQREAIDDRDDRIDTAQLQRDRVPRRAPGQCADDDGGEVGGRRPRVCAHVA